MIDRGLGKRGVRNVPPSALRLERVPVPKVEALHVLVVNGAETAAHGDAVGVGGVPAAVIDEAAAFLEGLYGKSALSSGHPFPKGSAGGL